jgi:hypothetical protein
MNNIFSDNISTVDSLSGKKIESTVVRLTRIYPAMSQNPKQLPNYVHRTEADVILIVV